MQNRFFLELAYHGKSFVGWQAQPNGIGVQQSIEEALTTIFQKPTKVVGCGRTDAGVHASQFYLHFDSEENLPENFLFRLNKLIGRDIAIHAVIPVAPERHARFDAIVRSYTYFLEGKKNPFNKEISTFFPQMKELDFSQMNEIVKKLPDFEEFLPFCKTNSDAKTMRCYLSKSEWIQTSPSNWEYHITSNRFLRGMVRLIVGMSLRVGMGLLSQKEVLNSMEQQLPLPRSYSAPAEGLFLSEVKYSFI